MPFYTSEQILNQAFDSETGTLKTSNDRLGTPGTGEPAHAGGSTGLIGWARDILAKIAAFGTAAAPSADVLSVQYPNAYVGKAALGGLNAALTVDTLGASQIAFSFPQATPGGMTVVCEGLDTAATTPVWSVSRWVQSTSGGIGASATAVTAGLVFLVDCSGYTQIRVRVAAYTSGSCEAIAYRNFTSRSRIVAELACTTYTTSSSQVQPLYTYTVNNTGVYYTDTTTPLAANATFTGSSRTMAAGNNAFNAEAVADQNFTTEGLRIQSSSDGSTWGATTARSGSAVVFGTASCVGAASIKRTSAFYRVVLINGVNAQSSLRLASSQTPN